MSEEQIAVINELLDREISNLVNVCKRVRNNAAFRKQIEFLQDIKDKLSKTKL